MASVQYFYVTFPCGAIVQIPTTDIGLVDEIRMFIQQFHRDKMAGRIDNELIILHGKYGELVLEASIKDLFQDEDYPVQLDVAF